VQKPGKEGRKLLEWKKVLCACPGEKLKKKRGKRARPWCGGLREEGGKTGQGTAPIEIRPINSLTLTFITPPVPITLLSWKCCTQIFINSTTTLRPLSAIAQPTNHAQFCPLCFRGRVSPACHLVTTFFYLWDLRYSSRLTYHPASSPRHVASTSAFMCFRILVPTTSVTQSARISLITNSTITKCQKKNTRDRRRFGLGDFGSFAVLLNRRRTLSIPEEASIYLFTAAIKGTARPCGYR
jgi:hypothetical protein